MRDGVETLRTRAGLRAVTLTGCAVAMVLVAMVGTAAADPPASGKRSMTFRIGPFPIGPYETLRNVNVNSREVPAPKIDGHITEMSVRVVNASGKTVPQSQVMLHHIAFVNKGSSRHPKIDRTCPRKVPDGERFYGTSEELRDMTFPSGYGYEVRTDDRWRSSWMLMNHLHKPRQVFIRYRVEVDTSPGVADVAPFWWDVMSCGHGPAFTVRGGKPPGSTFERRRRHRVPFDGRIVAIGGHLHGGGKAIALHQPRCGDRELFASRPTYGGPNHPLYRIRPVLHEPDPVNMSWLQSAQGLPVSRGERLKAVARYDGEWPRMRVMGIIHAYIARERGRPPPRCAPRPDDETVLGPAIPGRREPPYTRPSLAAWSPNGPAQPISRPPGETRTAGRRATVEVGDLFFEPANLSIARGGLVRWRIGGSTRHDITLVTGPRGFASRSPMRTPSFRRRLRQPGQYRIFCSLHPVWMSQLIDVRDGD